MTQSSYHLPIARLAATIVCLIAFLGVALSAAEPNQRNMRYTTRSAEAAAMWQQQLRAELSRCLRLDDLMTHSDAIPLQATVLSSQTLDGYEKREVELNSTQGRRIKAIVTLPAQQDEPRPAVVCIHGHGGNRQIVYEPKSLYRGFAAALATRGYVTIATDVGQHTVYEEGRTLMGERLWDLMRCIDYLESLSQVDNTRIGCGGLSLGGEMAMWLGGMDERMAATLSAGFLTKMDQMEQNHCLCWKFPGLRERADFADIYSLTAPRPLLCQNGLQEPPSQFPVALAASALLEISVIYSDVQQPQAVALLAHTEGHVINLPSLLAFFQEHLGR